MRKIRAVVYGVGEMGMLATRLATEKGVDIVGAIARHPDKVGRDLGEFAGLRAPLGVTIEDDAAAVLARTEPDVVLHATKSFLPEIREQLLLCVNNGANVVTISEESLFPWSSSPSITAELDAAAKANDVTITGGGHQDAFWLNTVSVLMGASHSIESVHGRATWNADEYGAEIIKSKHVGESLDQFRVSVSAESRPPTFGGNLLHALAEASDLTALEHSTEISPVVADDHRKSLSIGTTFEPGTVIGYSDIDRLTTREGITFTFEMSGYIYRPGEHDVNEWSITGEPDLRLENGVVPSYTTTCTQWVNRIPDVINSVPGFVSTHRLPAMRYRPRSFEHYLDDALD